MTASNQCVTIVKTGRLNEQAKNCRISDRRDIPFGKWFARLDAHAAAKITVALYRMEQGNFSNVKSVGKGVSEYRIDFGLGYRIYFAEEGDELVILLGGGVKKRQDQDIKMAQILWAEYKTEKKKG